MAGAALEIGIRSPQLEGIEARIRRLAAGLADTEPLLEALGAELETQTRRRIEIERTAPDGTPWPEWSDAYARTRHGGHELLQAEGNLLDSIQSLAGADLVETGSNLVYAALHQFGGEPVDIPVEARAYLGIGPDSEAGLDAILNDWADGIVAEALA